MLLGRADNKLFMVVQNYIAICQLISWLRSVISDLLDDIPSATSGLSFDKVLAAAITI